MMEYIGVQNVRLINVSTGEEFDLPVSEVGLTHELDTAGGASVAPMPRWISGEVTFSRRSYTKLLRLFRGLPLRSSRRAARRAHHRKTKRHAAH